MIDTLKLYGIPEDLPKVGLSGLSKTGKGTGASLLKADFGFATFTMSDTIRQYAREKDIELKTKRDFWSTRNRINDELGNDYLVSETLRNLGKLYQAQPDQVKGIAVDGIRGIYQAETFKKLPNSLLLAFVSHDELRYGRKRPDRPEDYVNYEDFLADEEDERIITEPVYPFAFTIMNNVTEEQFKKLLRITVMTNFGLSNNPVLKTSS